MSNEHVPSPSLSAFFYSLTGGLYGVYWIVKFAREQSQLSGYRLTALLAYLSMFLIFAMFGIIGWLFLFFPIEGALPSVFGLHPAATLLPIAIGVYISLAFALLLACRLKFSDCEGAVPGGMKIVLLTFAGFLSALYVQSFLRGYEGSNG